MSRSPVSHTPHSAPVIVSGDLYILFAAFFSLALAARKLRKLFCLLRAAEKFQAASFVSG